MDLSYSPQEERWRAELRAWLEQHPPGPEPARIDEWVAYGKAWQRQLYDAGWCGFAWPKAYGGRGATLISPSLFASAAAQAKGSPFSRAMLTSLTISSMVTD